MKKLLVIGAVLIMGVVSALMTTSLHATTGGTHRTVRTAGSETFAPNARIASNLRFIPGDVQIRSGGTLTLETGDSTQEPHTLTIVDADEVPASIDEVFECGAPDTVCAAVFAFFPESEEPPRVIEGPGTHAGIDGRLDTLLVMPGESVSATVTAPSGTTLYFICAIHAWMQGRIVVE
jgi:plastocyanin